MGVLERLSTLLRANINDMLDHAEDPEIMLNQILRDMEVEIGRAKSQVADMMAQETLFRDDLKAAQDKSKYMEDRAEYYVTQNNDSMAREALKRKADADSNITVLQQQLNAQTDMVSRLRSQLDALTAKYQDALSNRDALIARHRRAQAQQQMTRTMSNLDINDYSSDLNRMEQRIRTEEARTSAETQLNSDMMPDTTSMFDDAERNNTIDQQLAALKSRMGSSEAPRTDSSSSSTGTSGETRNLGTSQG
jgi:phage shock protein A